MNNTFYNGNINLKKSGIPVQWTEEMIREFSRCSEDPIYFSERYIKIVHVDRGFIPIELYNYQKDIINLYQNNRRIVALCARQSGKTISAVCIILHFIIFNSYKFVALLANKGDTAREILNRIQLAYEALPIWLQQGVVEWNKGSVEFENGSKIIASSTSSSAIRGKSVNLLYIDEAAFIENWNSFSASVLPTISSGLSTKIILTSTPNGLNHFYKICQGSRENINGYKIREVVWSDVPGRDEKWKDETLAELNFDLIKFTQEYENEFIGSSGTLISGATLKLLKYKEPINNDEYLKIYKEVEKEHNYVIVCDVSRGKGLDYSAFHVIDITQMPYKQVATFRNNMITPVEYSFIILNMAHHYNEAMILVEINDIGEQVSVTLYEDYEYENMLFTQSFGRGSKKLVAGGSSNSKVDKGIRTTKLVKAVGCSMAKLLIEQNQIEINDFNTIQELSTFSKKGSSWEAETGCHDDLVMGLVLFGWLSNQKFFKELTDINTINMLRDQNDDQIMNDLVPFGIIDNHIDEFEEDPQRINNSLILNY